MAVAKKTAFSNNSNMKNVFQIVLTALAFVPHTVRNIARGEEGSFKLTCKGNAELTKLRAELSSIPKTDGEPVRFGGTDDFGNEVFIVNANRALALADKLGVPMDALAIALRGQLPDQVILTGTIHRAGDSRRVADQLGNVVEGVHSESGVNFDLDFPNLDPMWLLEVAAKFSAKPEPKVFGKRRITTVAGNAATAAPAAETTSEKSEEVDPQLIAELVAKIPSTEGMSTVAATATIDAYIGSVAAQFNKATAEEVAKAASEQV